MEIALGTKEHSPRKGACSLFVLEYFRIRRILCLTQGTGKSTWNVGCKLMEVCKTIRQRASILCAGKYLRLRLSRPLQCYLTKANKHSKEKECIAAYISENVFKKSQVVPCDEIQGCS